MARSAARSEHIVARLERALEARPEVVVAVLHGSFALGTAYRDIDIAVWLDPARLQRDEWFRYALDLSVALQLQLQGPTDGGLLNDAPLAFRYHALQGRPLVARDQGFLADLRARTWDDYLDFKPFARQYLRDMLNE